MKTTRVMLLALLVLGGASASFAFPHHHGHHWGGPRPGFGVGLEIGVGLRGLVNSLFNPYYRMPYGGYGYGYGGLPYGGMPYGGMPPVYAPPVVAPPVMLPPQAPPQAPPPPPFEPGFSREECINFDFHGVRPNASLKLRITRTAPADRKVLYQRALYTLKFDTDGPAKLTADWVRKEIELLSQS